MSPLTIIKTGSVAEKDSQREVHAPAARKILYDTYKGKELVLSGVEVPMTMGEGKYRPLDKIQDIPALRKGYQDYKRNYERGMPIHLDPAVRNSLWIKAKKLKDEFTIGMVSKKDMHPVKIKQVIRNNQAIMATVVDNEVMKNTKAIERNQAHLRKNEAKIKEFKRIMRVLEPDNPKITDVERFRPSGL